MQNLHHVFESQSLAFNNKPDFAGLLSKKFGSTSTDELEELQELSLHATSSDDKKDKADGGDGTEKELSDGDNELIIMSKGHKGLQDVSLRVSKIERILETRTDLTRAQRRSLQSRKNTANFRERKRRAEEIRRFFTVEIDAVQNIVSTPLDALGHPFPQASSDCVFLPSSSKTKESKYFLSER